MGLNCTYRPFSLAESSYANSPSFDPSTASRAEPALAVACLPISFQFQPALGSRSHVPLPIVSAVLEVQDADLFL